MTYESDTRFLCKIGTNYLQQDIYNRLESYFTSCVVSSVAAVSLQGATCSSGAGSHAHLPTDDPASGAIWGSEAPFRDITAKAARAGCQAASIIIQPQMCFMFLFQRISFSFSSGFLIGGNKDLRSLTMFWSMNRVPVLRSAWWVPVGEGRMFLQPPSPAPAPRLTPAILDL